MHDKLTKMDIAYSMDGEHTEKVIKDTIFQGNVILKDGIPAIVKLSLIFDKFYSRSESV